MGVLLAALPVIAGVGAGAAQTAGLIGATSTLAAGLSTGAEVASAAGAVTGAVGAEQTAAAQQKAASYQSQVAANNQALANQAAQQTTAAGESQVATQELKTRADIGAIESAQAASNVNVNSGSAVDVRSSAASLGQLNALNIRTTAEQQAYTQQVQGTSYGAQSGLYQQEANQAPIAGAIGANSSLLSGSNGVANQYLAWTRYAGATGAGNDGSAVSAYANASQFG